MQKTCSFSLSPNLCFSPVGGCGLVAVECFAAMLFVSDFLQVGETSPPVRADIPGVGFVEKFPEWLRFFCGVVGFFKYLK